VFLSQFTGLIIMNDYSIFIYVLRCDIFSTHKLMQTGRFDQMIFVLDVGNTNTVLGVFDEDKLIHEWRIKTDRYKTDDEFAMVLKSLLAHEGISLKNINGIIISSVVPPIMFALEKMCRKYFKLEPLV